MSIGHSPDEAEFAPDMRKDAKDVTAADKKEAKRRIQGSFAGPPGDTSGDDSGGQKTPGM